MSKNKNVIQPLQFGLTRVQIEKLAQLADHFKDVNEFTLIRTHESGIGPTDRVRFTLFDNNDSNVDITDVSVW